MNYIILVSLVIKHARKNLTSYNVDITFCTAIFDIFDSDRGRTKVKIMTISPCSQRKLPEKLVCNISNILEKIL